MWLEENAFGFEVDGTDEDLDMLVHDMCSETYVDAVEMGLAISQGELDDLVWHGVCMFAHMICPTLIFLFSVSVYSTNSLSKYNDAYSSIIFHNNICPIT